jgi:hypothetical protein
MIGLSTLAHSALAFQVALSLDLLVNHAEIRRTSVLLCTASARDIPGGVCLDAPTAPL